MPKTVLFPVDTSINSRSAVHWFLENVHIKNDDLIFVHVMEPVYTSPAMATHGLHALSSSRQFGNMIMDEDIQEGKTLIDEFVVLSRNYGTTAQGFLVVGTNPGKIICKFCVEHKCDMVIIGSRGLSKTKETFIGSVSSYIIHHVSVPVMTIPPSKDTK